MSSPQLPQRRHRPNPQSRIHYAGVLLGLCKRIPDDGLLRGDDSRHSVPQFWGITHVRYGQGESIIDIDFRDRFSA